MKIQETSNRTQTELQIAQAQQKRVDVNPNAKGASQAPKAADSAGPAATVSLSSRGREIQAAMAKTSAAPDVRSDKVADVRRRLESGTYMIDPTRIARGILDSKA